MRRQVVRVAVVAVTVALALLAVPLAIATRVAFFADELGELERDALAAAVRVSPEFAAGDPVELPVPSSDARIGLYDLSMRLRAGAGPDPADGPTRRAAAGAVVQEQASGDLVVAVPAYSTESVVGVVRAASSGREVWNRVFLAWLALLGAALVAFGSAVFVARRQARALAAPLESLSRTARAVAAGDLAVRAAPSGIDEIDQAAATQNAMVDRLVQLLQRERDFTANASHQLRTPLTGLQLGLEAAATLPEADLRAAVEEALEQSRHLDRTIEDVLRLARPGPGVPYRGQTCPAAELLARVARRWHWAFARDGRRLTVTNEPGTQSLLLPATAIDQILDVLLGNAREHGRGTVEIRLRETGPATAIDIIDEGTVTAGPDVLFHRGATTGTGAGIGLSLARDAAEILGGRLTLTSSAPATFTLLLPPS
ncbi:HAMP domain-containing sensor histidine kinase [Parafrankia discariae]|uniref:HAMP domain-containing sensor histidine kinase n=1 Tax=Parafrankia discariae TaxID=365528 RepID=UPI000477232A|nr:HAMP domain-containing sensor histidine kinase [Parafrankia discariae]